MAAAKPGTLYIVGTPIGNLEDITLRALTTLKSADHILCEDTRHTAKLLHRHNIRTPMISLHEHNEASRVAQVSQMLEEGKTLAVVSDAGTPLISDPGSRLVAAIGQAGFDIVPIPGASAPATALSACGLDTHQGFHFLGFLPEKAGQRAQLFDTMGQLPGLLVFFVPPHDCAARLAELGMRWPDRPAVLCREMTKLHEQFHRGTLQELAAQAKETRLKGEMTLVIQGFDPGEHVELSDEELQVAIEDALSANPSLASIRTKDLSRLLADQLGEKSKRVYTLLLKSTNK